MNNINSKPNTQLAIRQDINGFTYSDANANNLLDRLPEDARRVVLSNLSATELCNLSLVSKNFYISSNDEFLWTQIAQRIMLPHDHEAKQTTSYKNYAKNLLQSHTYPRFDDSHVCTLKPRTQNLVSRIQQMNPSQFYLLNPNEAEVLFKTEDVKNNIELALAIGPTIEFVDSHPEIPWKNARFNHVAQQKVGKSKFDVFNSTEHLISFNEKGQLLLNNKPTNNIYPEYDCQFFIFEDQEYLFVFYTNKMIEEIDLLVLNSTTTKRVLNHLPFQKPKLPETINPDFATFFRRNWNFSL